MEIKKSVIALFYFRHAMTTGARKVVFFIIVPSLANQKITKYNLILVISYPLKSFIIIKKNTEY